MNRFSIRDIEQMSGIKAHTLRIWESRYDIISPKRGDTNRRFYDNEDLKHILRIAYLYNNGTKISKIAGLNSEELRLLAIHGINRHVRNENYLNRLLEATIDFNENRFEEVAEESITKTGFENWMLNIAYPYLVKIGLLWLTDSAIPAQEHFSSNIIRKKIICAIDRLKLPATNSKDLIALFTPPNEHHEIPLLLMQYFLKKSNRRTVYIGTNISGKILNEVQQQTNFTHLYCYVITHFAKNRINEYMTSLTRQFKKQQVILAGPLTKQVTIRSSNLILLQSLQSQLNFAEDENFQHGEAS